MVIEFSVSHVTHVRKQRQVKTLIKYLFPYNMESLKALSKNWVLK